MRNLMYGTVEDVRENLTLLVDVTHEELITAVLCLCGEIENLQHQIERLKNDKS